MLQADNKHVLNVLVENKPGVLARIASLFARRGYNIDSLAVGESLEPKHSRMTIVVHGDEEILEQITKQLNKLIDVIKVIDFTSTNQRYVYRELTMIKVSYTATTRSEIIELAEIFRAKIIDVSEKNLIIETTGDEGKINAMLQLLKKFGIVEIIRTGKVALGRG